VAVDRSHVYWADLAYNAIGRANLSGSGVKQRFITGANQPTGVAVDASHICWANKNAIGKANLNGTR
jgi:hypothetical protein